VEVPPPPDGSTLGPPRRRSRWWLLVDLVGIALLVHSVRNGFDGPAWGWITMAVVCGALVWMAHTGRRALFDWTVRGVVIAFTGGALWLIWWLVINGPTP
jgi:hypothetical protein